ncbi:ATP-binding protein [Streptomyces sp. NPDC050759]|uniref:ATP-binding protein n=1 Tax=Streptomyces sp. NPDC050759 TaxID=3365635 RepID=UPI00378B81E8
MHAKGPSSLRLTARGEGRLRVGVWDSHPYIPAPFARPPGDRVQPASLDAVGGRGLVLVQEFADVWAAGRSGTGFSTGVRGSCCGRGGPG